MGEQMFPSNSMSDPAVPKDCVVLWARITYWEGQMIFYFPRLNGFSKSGL